MTEAGWEVPGAISAWRVDDGACTIDFGGPQIAVTLPPTGGARIRCATTGVFAAPRSWSFVAEGALGSAVGTNVSRERDSIRVDAGRLTVSVSAGGRIVVDDDGHTLADGR